MDESHIAIVCREILEGLVYLHRQGKVTPKTNTFNIDPPRYQSRQRPSLLIRPSQTRYIISLPH
jgi:hypothetical protein